MKLISVGIVKRLILLIISSIVTAFAVLSFVHASNLNAIIQAEKSKLKLAQKSQSKVDKLDQERREIYDEYKAVLKEIEGLKLYNKQMGNQIHNQIKEKDRIETAIKNVVVTQRQIPPLMSRMIEGLEKFISMDVPFQLKERESRLNTLKSLSDRSEVTVSEKFRHVIEAYKTENEYGSTIETYKEKRLVNDVEREVDYLRIGRISWVYQTPDGKYSARWNQELGDWEELGGSYRNNIRDGIKIAQKQKSPDLIIIPVSAPE